MRITKVEMYSGSTEPVTFSVRDSDPTARYQARGIFGLDPDDLVRRFYGRGLNTNKKMYDFNLPPRDIVIDVILNPRFELDETSSDIRDELYRAISSNRDGLVTLYFKSGGTTVSQITGYISKVEVPYFAKRPEVQMTIHCDDPMLRGVLPVRMDIADLPSSGVVTIPDSLSTAPHGFVMQVVFTDAQPSFSIQDDETDPEWVFEVIPSGGFLEDDILYLSTEFSNRYVFIDRSSTLIQLVDKIVPTSIRPTIFPGTNEFWFPDIADFDWQLFEYYPAYWGV